MALTKIIATVGPSCRKVETLVSLIKAGVRVFRFNLKHGSYVWHSQCIENVKEASQKINEPVGVLLDFQGLNIRIGDLEDDIKIERGDKVNFVKKQDSSENNIVVSNSFFSADLSKNQKIFIDDGKIELKVLKSKGETCQAEVIRGGLVKSNKGINIPGAKVDLPSLLEKDIQDLSLVSKYEVDFIALSFVRNKEDIELLRKYIEKHSLSVKVLAKIENRQALENFDEILDVSDGIMIARGDLGIEIPLEQVPYYQKEIIKKCAEIGKPVITATQMLDSMTHHAIPSRAEVSDVANAILDYTDAIMLSQETAIGKYPLETVKAMERIASFWEKKRPPVSGFDFQLNHQTAAICRSAYNLWSSPFCQKENVKAFVVMTETGMTARMLSRLRPTLPIIALTNKDKIKEQLCLSYGVYPLILEYKTKMYQQKDVADIKLLLDRVKETNYIEKGDKVIVVYGEDWGTPGKTSIMRIQEVL